MVRWAWLSLLALAWPQRPDAFPWQEEMGAPVSRSEALVLREEVREMVRTARLLEPHASP